MKRLAESIIFCLAVSLLNTPPCPAQARAAEWRFYGGDRKGQNLFDKLTNKGMYAPVGLKPTLDFPGFHGGGNWSGGSFDPAPGLLSVNMNEDGAVGEMTPRPAGAAVPCTRQGRFEEYAWFRDERGWPCRRPRPGGL